MRELRWVMVVAGVVAMAGVVGCGSQNDCNLTPDLGSAPSSCNVPASTSVTVNVRWCSCGASTTCEVTYDAGSGIFNLEPKVSSCDASCETNPTSCNKDTVPCTFTTPATAGSGLTLQIINGLNTPKTVALNLGGSNPVCN